MAVGGDGVVTVCIPAYQAAPFIGRTLDHAQAQTHSDQRILVAVDASTDDTEEICRERARADDRISVIAHREPQRWHGNVNSLLGRVDSEFAFVYFHDDLIEPTYSERLVAALRAVPDAASAHCDVRLFGRGGERIATGRDYRGPAVLRLLTYLVVPDRGSMLRSMIRMNGAAGGLRVTPSGAAHEMAIVAAGPAVRVPEVLYHREHERPGGLGDGARSNPLSEVLEGLRWNVEFAREVIDRVDAHGSERELLEFGLRVFAEMRLRGLEQAHQAPGLTPITEVLDNAHPLVIPAVALDDDLREACQKAITRVERRTAARAAAIGR